MTRSARTAALAAAAPTAGLVLALLFATAAAAPEAVPQTPETAVAEPSPAPTATPTATPSPVGPIRSPHSRVAGGVDGVAEVRPEDTDFEGSPEPQVTAPVPPTAPAPAPSIAPSVPEEQSTDGVDVGVSIDPPVDGGALTMTVAGDAAALSESGSTATARRFLGVLPTVTVRDTRDPDAVPEGADWSVLGTAADLTGDDGQPALGVEHLGWAPRLLEGDGPVVAGPAVRTVLDGRPEGPRPGLVSAELLALADGAAARPGRWTADAELVLRTAPSVRAGGYSSVVTLSLFE